MWKNHKGDSSEYFGAAVREPDYETEHCDHCGVQGDLENCDGERLCEVCAMKQRGEDEDDTSNQSV